LNLRPLVCLALIHLLVDGFAQVVAPLWPRLQTDLGLRPLTVTLLFSAWQLATSISQPIFGCWGDRFNSRWMIALGPALAIVCVSSIGLVHDPALVTLLLIAGGLGIGAFHPEAAVGVVEASGSRPGRGLAVFTFGGMFGLGMGPILSGRLIDTGGLGSLIWLAPPALLLLAVLVLWGRPTAHAAPYAASSVGLAVHLDAHWRPAVRLLAVSTLRAIPALGVPLGLAFLLSQRGASETAIGEAQGVFLLSGGLGTLVCPLFVRPGRELRVLIGLSLPAVACLLLLAWGHPVAYPVGLAGSGLLLQGAVPILIAYSQRVLPGGQRLAASLTLGASWGLAGMIVGALQWYFTRIGYLEGMIWAMVPCGCAASVAVCFLPRVPTRLETLPARSASDGLLKPVASAPG
jgi:FSR family fosmidomycin resistance protein-like MFS transporter